MFRGNIYSRTLCFVFFFSIFHLGLACEVYPHSIDELKLMLKNRDSRIRLSAMEEIDVNKYLHIEKEELLKICMNIVEDRDEDWKVRAKAIKLLGEIRNPAAIEVLIKALDDIFFSNDCPALKWSAAVALGNFNNDQRIIDALISALGDKTLYVREAAIQSLGKIGNSKAVPFLIQALHESGFAIKFSAISALGKIGDPLAIPSLKKILENDNDIHIKKEAVSALRKLQNSYR